MVIVGVTFFEHLMGFHICLALIPALYLLIYLFRCENKEIIGFNWT